MMRQLRCKTSLRFRDCVGVSVMAIRMQCERSQKIQVMMEAMRVGTMPAIRSQITKVTLKLIRECKEKRSNCPKRKTVKLKMSHRAWARAQGRRKRTRLSHP